MPNNSDNRVLGRRNARHLSTEELKKILGKGSNQVITLHFTGPFFPDE
jgi:hypothetical protein